MPNGVLKHFRITLMDLDIRKDLQRELASLIEWLVRPLLLRLFSPTESATHSKKQLAVPITEPATQSAPKRGGACPRKQ